MSSNITQNVLFYSEKCKTCNLFITLCHNNKILKFFNLINVDNNIKQFSQQGLKIVPTIFIKGLNRPIEGKDVFKWLESAMTLNNNTTQNTINSEISKPNTGTGSINPNNNIVKRTIVPPPIIKQEEKPIINTTVEFKNGIEIKKNNPVKKDIFGFTKDEFLGISESYTFLDDNKIIPKSFLPHDCDMEIYTAPEGTKLDKKEQDRLIKDVETIRENDKQIFLKKMNNDHNNILQNNNDS